MWRDISSTQVHQSLNPYQQYPPPSNGVNNNGNTNGGNKWNVPGQRSSYSLPHPGHAQSNMRWQKTDLNNQLSTSTKNLTHTPSFLHPSNDPAALQQRPGLVGQRQRPASMYDTPSTKAYLQNGLVANKNVAVDVPNARSGTLRQNAGELVSQLDI